MPVSADDALVDRPGRLDLDVLVDGEQRVEAGALLLGEQAGAGVQGPPGSVERIVTATAVAVEVLLDTAAAPVQRVPGEADDVEGGPSPRPRRAALRWW